MTIVFNPTMKPPEAGNGERIGRLRVGLFSFLMKSQMEK